MTEAMRVLIADDHPGIRAGVRAALESQGCHVCADVADASTAVEAALRERPDVCLLDVRMPGDGIVAAARITDALPGTAVVMLTVSRDDGDLFAALRAGANGYLLKDIAPEQLVAALESARRGEAPLPPVLVARLVEEIRGRGHRLAPLRGGGIRLTQREGEVLDLLAQDLSTAQIARRLGITPATVRGHVARLLRRLDVPDRESARRLLRRDG